jgi:hypothetical protein
MLGQTQPERQGKDRLVRKSLALKYLMDIVIERGKRDRVDLAASMFNCVSLTPFIKCGGNVRGKISRHPSKKADQFDAVQIGGPTPSSNPCRKLCKNRNRREEIKYTAVGKRQGNG